MFNPIELDWKGEKYTIEADNVLRLIAKVEDHLTLGELWQFQERGGAPLGKISAAFGVMLRYAGARVKDEEIYTSLTTGGADAITSATSTLLLMMVPPSSISKSDPEDAK